MTTELFSTLPVLPGHNSVVGGPSREELFDALRLRFEGRSTRMTLSNGDQISIFVQKLEMESGCGNSWIFSGYQQGARMAIEGCFNTKSRTGWISQA